VLGIGRRGETTRQPDVQEQERQDHDEHADEERHLCPEPSEEDGIEADAAEPDGIRDQVEDEAGQRDESDDREDDESQRDAAQSWARTVVGAAATDPDGPARAARTSTAGTGLAGFGRWLAIRLGLFDGLLRRPITIVDLVRPSRGGSLVGLIVLRTDVVVPGPLADVEARVLLAAAKLAGSA
jgi:hypothetical protein